MSSSQPRLESQIAELQQQHADLQAAHSELQKKNAALETELAALKQLHSMSIHPDEDGDDDDNADSLDDDFVSCRSSPSSVASDDVTPPPPPTTPTHHGPPMKAPVRDPGLVSLAVSLEIATGNTQTSQELLLHASDCPTISQFCDRLATSASGAADMVESTFYPPNSPPGRVPDLSRVSIKLEEDGYIAEFMITPTRLNASSPFPDLQYRAWYYRNIIKGRGDKAEYTVDVKMTI
ncbi:hypothetical protein PV05_02510 [Exophiala xenobiotica]|uniref:Uncharacterized protein n=1 Tax=Exophiala xenobiotica TaxID=348802 RepID=A0A0D2BZS7_9EURO|nr:uncharacterized protein PV05_02510 [Exophiala xenobiotica]KIW57956.1 hypothetical protein PV05_02510 [Exophiala xenobiotica]